MDTKGLPYPKPERRATTKRRRQRKERAVVGTVREQCVDRDGYCRLQGVERFPPCRGRSEWAHFGEHKRFKTRGMAPEDRHKRDASLMMCDGHHDLYDANELQIEALTERGTDGPLRFSHGGQVYEEVR